MRVVIAIFDDDIAFNNDNGSGVDSIDNDKDAELVDTWLCCNLVVCYSTTYKVITTVAPSFVTLSTFRWGSTAGSSKGSRKTGT